MDDDLLRMLMTGLISNSTITALGEPVWGQGGGRRGAGLP